MRKPELNFAVDALAFFLFLNLTSTGLLIYLVVPPASGLAVWGLDRHEWGDIHFWIAVSFLALMAVHFLLHWDWIKANVKGKSKESHISRRRITLALLLLIIALFLLIAPFLSPVKKNEGGQHGRNSELIENVR